MSDQFDLVITGSGEVRDADGNLVVTTNEGETR